MNVNLIDARKIYVPWKYPNYHKRAMFGNSSEQKMSLLARIDLPIFDCKFRLYSIEHLFENNYSKQRRSRLSATPLNRSTTIRMENTFMRQAAIPFTPWKRDCFVTPDAKFFNHIWISWMEADVHSFHFHDLRPSDVEETYPTLVSSWNSWRGQWRWYFLNL